ncbi:hypothetical protein CSUI_005008, partial [Cystoisospora suis]
KEAEIDRRFNQTERERDECAYRWVDACLYKFVWIER